MKVATTQFSLDAVTSEDQFWKRFRYLMSRAEYHGAEIVVFPEYFSLSLLMFQKKGMSFNQALLQSKDHADGVLTKAKDIAKEFKIAIVLGTLPWAENGKVTNRSHFIEPNGKVISQDKIYMTRFENEEWKIQAGSKQIQIFNFKGKTCAILTCYDSEFAAASLPLAQAGVELLFVPSCTDSLHGYWRVRHCCEARAVENQLFVVMSSIVGGDRQHEAINEHSGQGAIFGPCDTGFPPDGVLVTGDRDREGITIADLDFTKLQAIRKNGTVLNLQDSKNQTAVTAARV